MFQFREYKPVNIRLCPGCNIACWCGRGRRRCLQRLERPEGALFGRDHILARFRTHHRHRRLGPIRASLHPRGQIQDFLILEFAAHGHLEFRIGLPDRLNQEAFVGIAQYHCRAGFSAFEDALTAI